MAGRRIRRPEAVAERRIRRPEAVAERHTHRPEAVAGIHRPQAEVAVMKGVDYPRSAVAAAGPTFISS